MNALTLPGKRVLSERDRIDWNSLFLLLMLAVPAAVMWVMLFLWPGVSWVAAGPFTALEVLGSFAVLLLAVFLIVRYKDRPGAVFMSAGLTGMAILEGFLVIAPPQSNEYVWLHSMAGIFGGAFILTAALMQFSHSTVARRNTTASTSVWLIGGCAMFAFTTGALTLVFSSALPSMYAGGTFSVLAWALNTIPVAMFLVAGTSLFYHYRITGARDLFLFTAIVIFLFQASEVFYFARMWNLIWWFWQGLRLAVYFTILGYTLREYIQTSDSLAMEILERRRAETAVRTAEQDWRNSFNSLDDVMLIVNSDFTIERINESGLTLLGKGSDELVGQKCAVFFHGTQKPGSDCPCRRSFRSGKVALTEHHAAFGRTFAIKSAPIVNGGGKPAKCVCLMRDITREVKAREKEKELQQELALASRLASIGEVAAGIAHEINNPLTGVIGFSQMLSTMNIPAEMREAVDVIHDGARRTAGIVEKLLTFARRSKSTKEFLNVNEVLKSTIDIRAYEMHTNNTELTASLAPDLPGTMANFGQLQQVFLNLIVNAEQSIHFTGKPGKINVKTEKLNGKIRLTMTDNGTGIPKQDLGKLFDPFFTTKADNGGTGLGLSISYGIIKEHGGTIKVKSSPGNGATFIIDLPVTGTPVAGEKAIKQEMPLPAPVKKARVIVVDDEASICRVLNRILTREGHEVDTAFNAEAAMERLQAKPYDLILLDMKMPGMSGIDLYNRMKEIDPCFPQKVVFLTGDIITPRNLSFLEKTKVAFVTKPFTGESLLRHVNYALGGQGKNA